MRRRNWHLDEHGQLRSEDLARQEILERAGWEFIRVPYRNWRENPEAEVERLINALRGESEVETDSRESVDCDNKTAPPLTLEKHQWAIIHAIKGGSRSICETYRDAREAMGFSRMGPRIQRNLDCALEELSVAQILKVEEGEIYFRDEISRNRHYTVSPHARPSKRKNSGYYDSYRNR